MIKIMKVNPYYISVFLLTISACILTYFLIQNKSNQSSQNQETYDTYENINDTIEKSYQLYKKDIEKYRIGVPKKNYDNPEQRIHQAPYPSDPYTSTLPRQNKLFIDPEDMECVKYYDFLNKK